MRTQIYAALGAIALLFASRVDAMDGQSADMTAAEVAHFHAHLSKCWKLPAEATGPMDFDFRIKFEMKKDATPRKVTLLDAGEFSDLQRSIAESSIKFVSGPNCLPYPLPMEKYHQWSKLTLHFNLREWKPQ